MPPEVLEYSMVRTKLASLLSMALLVVEEQEYSMGLMRLVHWISMLLSGRMTEQMTVLST